MKVIRRLVTVKFVSWVPTSVRLAQQGQIAPDAKIGVLVNLWAPWPVDENGQWTPDALPPHLQGVLWAINEVIKQRPDGREVLAIDAVEVGNLYDTGIMNQPPMPGVVGGIRNGIEGMEGIDSITTDTGLTPGLPDLGPKRII